MKVSKEKVAENRAALIASATKLFKEKGFDGVGVIEISANAGLTQGAFYGQFASKNGLATEACRQDFIGRREFWVKNQTNDSDDVWAYVQQYLHQAHVDHPADGCPMAAYSNEIVRQHPEVAAAFAEGASAAANLLEERLAMNMPPAAARSRALFMIGALSGVVSMVRAISRTNADLAKEILEAALLESFLMITPTQNLASVHQHPKEKQ